MDIHRALQNAEKLLDHYGGHAQAAGLSLRAENIPLLQNALDLWISENVPNAAYIPCREYDLDVSFDRLSVENVRELNLLEPTGCENPSPVFRAQPYVYRSRAVGIDKRHLQLSLSSNGVILNGIYFGAGQLEDNLAERVDILYEPGINAYNGSVNVQALVRALNTSDHDALFTRLRGHEAELQRNFLTDLFYNYRHRLLSCGGTAEVSIDALRHLLCASPQGTLILAADVHAMKRVLCAAEGLPLDILTADQPVDPRSFNTLIVYPKGDLPKGFRRIICADMPHGYAGGALLAPEEHVAWTDEIPELEQLRTLYVQLKTLTQDSDPCTLRRATAELSARTGLPPNGALAGLYTLLDLELFRMDDCGRLVKAEKKRADPSKSGFYTGLMNWKHSLSDKN